MRPVTKIALSLVGAVVAAALVGAFSLSITSQARTQLRQSIEGEMTSVFVPVMDLKAGTTITENMLTEQEYPLALLPDGTASTIEDLVGKTIANPLFAGEPVNLSRLGEDTGYTSLTIEPGMVAASVSVTEERAAGGAVYPGSHVRLVVTSQDGGTTVVAEDVIVLDTSNGAVQDDEGGFGGQGALTWITLSLTESSVTSVLNAADLGRLHVVLLPSSSGS
jgi:Flp pilus assembly protein CpaB